MAMMGSGVITYGDVGDTVSQAITAATLTKVTTVTMQTGSRPWTLKKILVSLAGDTITDIVGDSYVELQIDRVKGPFKFPLANSIVGATSGVCTITKAIEIDINIPVDPNAKVEIWVSTTSQVECTAGLVYV